MRGSAWSFSLARTPKVISYYPNRYKPIFNGAHQLVTVAVPAGRFYIIIEKHSPFFSAGRNIPDGIMQLTYLIN